MTDKKLYRLTHKTARAMAVAHVEAAPEGYSVEVRPPRRTDDASRAMHAKLGDIAKQVPSDHKEFDGVRPWAIDPVLADKLWTLSERMTGVKFEAA